MDVIEDIDTMSEPDVELKLKLGKTCFTSCIHHQGMIPVQKMCSGCGTLMAYLEKIPDIQTGHRSRGSSRQWPWRGRDDEDRIAIGGIEGEDSHGGSYRDESFSTINGASYSVLARGANLATISERVGPSTSFDSVSPIGPVATSWIDQRKLDWSREQALNWLGVWVSDRSDGLFYHSCSEPCQELVNG